MPFIANKKKEIIARFIISPDVEKALAIHECDYRA